MNLIKISSPQTLSQLILRRMLVAYIVFATSILGILIFLEYRVVKAEIVSNLHSMVGTFKPGAESALWELQGELLNSMVNGIGANPIVVSVEIVGLEGKVGASWRSPSGARPSPDLTVQQTLHHTDVYGLQDLGYLRIASSDAVLMSRLGDSISLVVMTTSAIFIFLALLIWFLIRSVIVKPLVVFSDQVETLFLSGQGKPIDLGKVKVGEIETLKLVFNQLMKQLAESHGQIAKQNVLLNLEKDALKRESEKNLALLRNASDGIHILDADGNIIEVSDSFCSMIGYGRDELTGMNLSQWSTSRSAAELQKILSKLLLRGGRYQFETTHQRKDGAVFDVEISGVALMLDGKPALFSSSRDITERKQNEIELRIAATAFQSESSVMITDANTVILRVNQAFVETSGYSSVEVVGHTPRLFKSGRHDAEFYRSMWEAISVNGAWQGEIWDRRKNGEIYPKWLSIAAVKDEKGAVTHYVGSHIDITDRKASEEKIQYLAFYDHLTALPNRLLLMDRLQQAFGARSNRKGALLIIDLDNFKNLNDTLGHDFGDILLQQVTQRLKSCVREGDTVARLGGDEFVVLLLNLSEQSMEAAAISEYIGTKILSAVSQPYQLKNHMFRCTASIGVTLFDSGDHAKDELMKQADIAMYQAKKAGRNAIRYFDQNMQDSIAARVYMENELHNALESQQLHLYYQIQVDEFRCPIGAEALIRWIHPVRGMVSPIQFIPLAEESGLILPIGNWVLERACAQLKSWQQDARTKHFTLAVNVSAKQFRQTDFVTNVKAALLRHEVNANLLKLELTESLLLENIEKTVSTMNALNSIGVHFSLDDFGTGYSSLQYLKQLPLDQLKIDKSFVRDIETDVSDLAIVRTIIAMAHSLSISVIAEGVETEEQKERLLMSGCSNYQGYLFGKPLPIDEFDAALSCK
ncbi:EAL domain-containing protein [Rhodoferax sp. GW822-FHT02A01]|uniref:EAL domain-containing protein n=1 Tax=Rhodoferax sp. GW822-FHT02A01 TaxID=3141537 RepID=UPI00315CC3FA